MMRDLAALWFSTDTCRLAITDSKRDCDAPSVARSALTVSSAVSMLSITTWIAATSAVLSISARPAPVLSVPATDVMVASDVRSMVVMSMVSSAVVLAPTWNCMAPASTPSTCLPLNVVAPSTRCTSLASSPNSLSSESLSLAELVALADCTASSRMRCSASATLPSDPSLVCAIEMPSLALRTAAFMPRTWAFMRSAIARPAASSLAEFTRRPDESRCIDVAREPCDVFRLRCAFSEAMFVLIVWGMWATPGGVAGSASQALGPL